MSNFLPTFLILFACTLFTWVYSVPMENTGSFSGSHNIWHPQSSSPPRLLPLFPVHSQRVSHGNELPDHSFGQPPEREIYGQDPNHPLINFGGQDLQAGEHIGSAHQQSHPEVPIRQSYGINTFNNNNFVQGIPLEQGSLDLEPPLDSIPIGTAQILQGLPSLPRYAQRHYRPREELEARPERLNRYEWQRRYTEDELYTFYNKIIPYWKSIPRTTLSNMDKKFHTFLQNHPNSIDIVLNVNDYFAIRRIANEGQPNFASSRRLNSEMKTPREYLIWLFHPKMGNDPDSEEEKTKKMRKMISKLKEQWKMSEEAIMKRLAHLNDSELKPYMSGLVSSRSHYNVLMAAHQLDKVISAREAASQHVQSWAGSSSQSQHEDEVGSVMDPQTWRFWPNQHNS